MRAASKLRMRRKTSTMIDLADIQRRLAGHSIVGAIDQLPQGHVRIQTRFLYPEGSFVDLFLRDEKLLPPTHLSDLGQTMTWLLDVQVRPSLSKKRQTYVNDALAVLGVEQNQGALECALPSMDDLVDGIVRLGQACVRVSDLMYTRRSSSQSELGEELEEVLLDGELSFDANQELEGRSGRKVRVDFLVQGRRRPSAVLTLASGSRAQAHAVANEIFGRWYDLDIPQRPEQRVTIFDDRVDVYRQEDLDRLQDLSEVVALSNRQAIVDLLAA